MKHIYLSPHLDDAVLSCGGLIYNQRSKGEAVAVATLCSGFPDYNHLPPLARQWHAKCGNFENLMAERRAEDRCVLDGLGVEIQHWSTLEGIYRYIGGEIAYPDQSSLFSFVQPSEMTSLSEIWQMELDKLIPDPSAVTLYAPLAIGNHVDHQLARSLAADLNPDSWHVRFYEDVPYVEKPGALQAALRYFKPSSLQADIVAIDLDAKISMICGYKTQISVLFGSENDMKRRIKRFSTFTSKGICDLSYRGNLEEMEVNYKASLPMAGYKFQFERIWKRLR